MYGFWIPQIHVSHPPASIAPRTLPCLLLPLVKAQWTRTTPLSISEPPPLVPDLPSVLVAVGPTGHLYPLGICLYLNPKSLFSVDTASTTGSRLRFLLGLLGKRLYNRPFAAFLSQSVNFSTANCRLHLVPATFNNRTTESLFICRTHGAL